MNEERTAVVVHCVSLFAVATRRFLFDGFFTIFG